jgi:hypothetical protein
MSKVRVTKTLSGWSPCDDYSRDHWRKSKMGIEYRAEIVKPRASRTLKMWWILCNLIYENSDKFKSPDQVHQYLKILAGHTTVIVSESTGEIYHLADSIDFATLDEDAFLDVFKRTVAAVCEHIMPTVKSYELRQEIDKLMACVPDPRSVVAA